MMKELLFISCGMRSVEMEMTAQMLRDEEIRYENIETLLTHGNDKDVYSRLSAWADNHRVYLMPEVPTERFKRLLPKMTQLAPNYVVGDTPVILQVAAIISHYPTPREKLVARYATAHIAGLKQAGATREEIQLISLWDRLAACGDMDDEHVAAKILSTNFAQSPEKNVRTWWTGEIAKYPTIERAVVDGLLTDLKPEEDLYAGFFALDGEGLVAEARLYLSRLGMLSPFWGSMVGKLALGYSVMEHQHERGVYFFRLRVYDERDRLEPEEMMRRLYTSPFI